MRLTITVALGVLLITEPKLAAQTPQGPGTPIIVEAPPDFVCSLAFSPDNKTLASVHSKGFIEVCDARTRKVRVTLRKKNVYLGTPLFLPDYKTLAAAFGDGMVTLWDVETGKERAAFSAHRKAVISLAVTPDGRSLASGGLDRTVKVWDSMTGKPRVTITARDAARAPGGSLALSPDGKLLAFTRSDSTICLCRTDTGRQVRTLHSENEKVRGWWLTFSPDGKMLAAETSIVSKTSKGSVVLWEVASGRERASLKGNHCAAFEYLAFLGDGRVLLTWDYDGEVKLWDVVSGEALTTFKEGHPEQVTAVAVSPDGKTAVLGGLEGVPLRFWDVTEWTRRQPRTQELPSRDIQTAWEGLAGEDAAAAYRALGTLIRAPEQAVPYLRGRLRPVAPAGKQVRQWVADLDSDDFAARERATEELRKAGESAELALRQALEGGLSAEVRRRVEGLLKRIEASAAVRAVEVLEYIGTPEAKEVLQWLAQGVPQARLTQEAKASVERLGRRAGKP